MRASRQRCRSVCECICELSVAASSFLSCARVVYVDRSVLTAMAAGRSGSLLVLVLMLLMIITHAAHAGCPGVGEECDYAGRCCECAPETGNKLICSPTAGYTCVKLTAKCQCNESGFCKRGVTEAMELPRKLSASMG